MTENALVTLAANVNWNSSGNRQREKIKITPRREDILVHNLSARSLLFGNERDKNAGVHGGHLYNSRCHIFFENA